MWRKQRLVQQININAGGETQLARLQDDVLVVHVPKQTPLCRSHAERDKISLLVLNFVQVIETPPGIAEIQQNEAPLLRLRHS
ncbi:hypothetical protein [Klebsiella michiganensis]|uniref:hypothetical protein n=1 Tax=Klebsiella michiganensis TaxID=1134687 RepID=UPI00376498BE